MGQSFIETVQLGKSGILFFVVRCGHMGESAAYVEMGEALQFLPERRHIGRMDADAVHACIDSDPHAGGLACGCGGLIETIHVDRVIHRKGEIIGDTGDHIFRKGQAQHINGAGEASVAEFFSFFRTGDSGSRIPLFQSDAECLDRAVAVSIGFHHSEGLHFFRQMGADHAKIVTERVQIDFDARNRHGYTPYYCQCLYHIPLS